MWICSFYLQVLGVYREMCKSVCAVEEYLCCKGCWWEKRHFINCCQIQIIKSSIGSLSRSLSSVGSFFIWTCDRQVRDLSTLLVSKTAPELSEPSDPQQSTQMNATFLHFPGDAPGNHLYFLAESYNPHFFAFFSGFVPAMLLVCFTCLNPCSVSVSSVCFLLHPHILCFSLHFLQP